VLVSSLERTDPARDLVLRDVRTGRPHQPTVEIPAATPDRTGGFRAPRRPRARRSSSHGRTCGLAGPPRFARRSPRCDENPRTPGTASRRRGAAPVHRPVVGHYYTDWLWFRQLGYEGIFIRTMNAAVRVCSATFRGGVRVSLSEPQGRARDDQACPGRRRHGP
jgi:hypothetical protein